MGKQVCQVMVAIVIMLILAFITSVISLAVLYLLGFLVPLKYVLLISLINQIVLELQTRYVRRLLRMEKVKTTVIE